MYCRTCGYANADLASFCGQCGQALTSPHVQAGSPAAGRTGYSPLIHDPAFARYVGNANKWAVIFASVLAAAAFIGFTIAGEVGDTLDNPQAMLIGTAIGGMFLLIALAQVLGRKRSKTWDGIVVDKRVEQKRRRRSQDDRVWYETVTVYTVVIRRQDGKLHRITHDHDDTVYQYYAIGDAVRHHGGLNSFEKYDKSGDTIIFCNACGSLNDIQAERCARCSCPLLK